MSTEEDKKEHPFDRLMFGSITNTSSPKKEEQQEESNLLNQVNLEELMTHIDTLMESAKHLKPMFHKIRPFIGQFIKK